jgi:predicted RNA-binding Zn-ribbon protein involved in translation (DUF1610 family)
MSKPLHAANAARHLEALNTRVDMRLPCPSCGQQAVLLRFTSKEKFGSRIACPFSKNQG